MTRLAFVLSLAAALLIASSARAACEGHGPENAISVRPVAFFNHGVAAEYERFLAPPRWSLALGPEIRWGAHGDFSAHTAGIAVEPRFWLMGRSFFGCLGERAMVGLFLGARFDLALTWMSDELADRSIGTMWTFAHTLDFGFRATVSRVAITPTLGLAAISEAGGGLAIAVRPTVKLGLAVGVMF